MESAIQIDVANILLIEESAMFRQVIARSLNECDDLSVVAFVANIADANIILATDKVDLVILGSTSVDEYALAWAEKLKIKYTHVKIILLADNDNLDMFLWAVRIGIEGYVLTLSPYDQLLDVIRVVLAGECAYDPAIGSNAIKQLVTNDDCSAKDTVDFQTKLESLSARERQVVDLLTKGLANKEICQELSISMSTTKTHISKIFKQLGISSRRELLPKFYMLG